MSVLAVQFVLITVVAAVVISVTQPVGLHTDVGRLALEVATRAGGGGVLTALQGFVRGLVVATVVYAVTHLAGRKRSSIQVRSGQNRSHVSRLRSLRPNLGSFVGRNPKTKKGDK